MNLITQMIAEKIKEVLETPTAASVTAGSMGLMGYLEVAYHVSQDFLGWLTLALSAVIGVIVLRINLLNWRIKKIELREREISLLRAEVKAMKDHYDTN